MQDKESKSLSDVEWEQRTLCTDESCIGVIGPDGRCRECDLPLESVIEEEFSEAAKEVAENDQDESIPDIEWQQRTLCTDESCIGVIGPDGRCRECGLPSLT